MDIKVTSRKISGTAKIISSKSELHRLLIISALCTGGEPTVIKFNGSPSQDVIATVNCLKSVGAKITRVFNTYKVYPIKDVPLECANVCPNESGSTLRFILPVFSALGINFRVIVKGRLGERPLSPLYELMTANGVSMTENGKYPLSVSGKLSAKTFKINGNVSSQFISGLLMSLPLMGGGKVRVTGNYQSKPYVDITVDIMRKFGIEIIEDDNVYTVTSTEYKSPSKINAGGDWSNSAFLFSLGAIAGKVKVKGLETNSLQGDKAVLEILRSFGATVVERKKDIIVKKGKLVGTEIDASNIPDLIPTLAVVGAVAEGKTVVRNAGRLRLKESDRIKSVVTMIKSLGGRADETSDGLIIYGNAKLNGGAVDSFNDHRIVMSSAVASAVSRNPVIILGANAVNKSYPKFFKVIKRLGLKIKEI